MKDLGQIGFNEEQAALLDVATSFCRDKSPIDKVRTLIDCENGFDPDLWQEIVALGWLGIAVEEEYGGSGLGLAETVPVAEQMGRHLMATPFLSCVLAAELVEKCGTLAQKQDLLPKITQGLVVSPALMELDGDWAGGALKVQAQPDDDGASVQGVVLQGRKTFVCDASSAEFFIVSALCQGVTALFVVPRSALKVGALRREKIIDETKRSWEVNFDGVRVAAAGRMVQADVAAGLEQAALAACLLASAEEVGCTKSVIDYTVEYLKTRKQFGKLIGAYQSLKHPLVDAFVLYQQARSHLYSAAHCFSLHETGEIATRMARATSDKALSYAADRAIQFHGGFGFTYDCDAQLYRRRALWYNALYGDGAYHRQKLAGLLF